MPGSVTSAFSEREDFEAALRAEGCLGLLITGRGQFRAQLTPDHAAPPARVGRRGALVADRLCRSTCRHDPDVVCDRDRAFANLGWDRGANPRDRDPRSRPAYPRTNRRGQPLGHDPLAGRGSDPVRSRVDRSPVRRASRRTVLAAPTRGRPERLRQLHAAIRTRLGSAAGTCRRRGSAHGLEQQLIHALVDCLSAGSAEEATLAGQPAPRPYGPLRGSASDPARTRTFPIEEICRGLDVSERTLRILCARSNWA